MECGSNIGNYSYPALVNGPDARYAVSLGSGLSFEAGKPWNHKYTAALEGRLVPITVPFLLDKGLLSQELVEPVGSSLA